MVLVINNQVVNVSTATFHPATGKFEDAIVLTNGDVSSMYMGETARAVWEKMKHLADAVIEVTEVEAE